MNIVPTAIPDVLVIEPKVFGDARGFFFESFNQRAFNDTTGTVVNFVQDNESCSAKGVLRGLHFQAAPHAQGKLVHVIRGAVLDICVDIRPQSPTFGQHFKMRLDGISKEMLWIPAGFAHGFLALEDDTLFAYKCSGYYDPPSERTLAWDDPALGIEWGISNPIISPKDREGLSLKDLHAVLTS